MVSEFALFSTFCANIAVKEIIRGKNHRQKQENLKSKGKELSN